MRVIVETLRNPFRCFLVIATLVGFALVVAVPGLAGIDEPAHFERTYAISRLDLVPKEIKGFDGGVVCIPRSIAEQYRRHGKDASKDPINYLATARSQGGDPACGRGEVAIDVATFSWYSPLGYLPQAVGVGLVRLVSDDVQAMDLLGRLFSMLAYVGLVALAIRRTPIGKWAFVAAGLIPASIYEASTSLSPGPLTVAFSLLVVSSALRMCDPADDRPTRVLVAEAAVLTVALALCKPSYLVVAIAYALPLIGTPRRWARWPVLAPIGLAAIVSYLWQHETRDLFVCDVRYFGVGTNPGRATDALIAAPLSFLWESARSVYDFAGNWTEDLVRIGVREMDWPVSVSVIVLIGFALVSIQRDRTETLVLNLGQRAVLLVGLIAGFLAVLAAWLIYCSEPVIDIVGEPHARLFLPLMVLIPLVFAPPRGRIVELARARVPIGAALALFFAVWTPSLIAHLRADQSIFG